MAFLSSSELQGLGLSSYGDNVLISDKASIHRPESISLGSNVRIDDFCILSAGAGGIRVGSHVHIGAATTLIGAAAITMGDFCNISSRVSIFSSSDDFSGLSLTNPTVFDEFKNVTHAAVIFQRHVIVGCGSVILPGVELKEGCAVASMSLVKESCEAFVVYGGIPASRLKNRSKEFLLKEAKFLDAYSALNKI